MKTITVDFDDTLAEERWTGWTTQLQPIQKVVDFVCEKAEEGYDIHIVTYRYPRHLDEVHNFVKVYSLPIKQIVATGMKPKGPYIKQLGAELHVDDDIWALISAEEHGVEGLLVTSEHSLPNSTAHLFNTI
jgi:hypothetical protein